MNASLLLAARVAGVVGVVVLFGTLAHLIASWRTHAILAPRNFRARWEEATITLLRVGREFQ